MAVVTWGSAVWGSFVYGGQLPDEGRDTALTIYNMLMLGVRVMDEQATKTLQLFTQALDISWEDNIYERCSELPTLFEIDNVDSKWLSYLKPLMGFTQDLSFEATDVELRKILKVAVTFWNEKPSEFGVIEQAIRMVTGNKFRALNYFDMRSQSDQTCLTEELENFDPNVLDFGAYFFSGLLCKILTANTFRIDDFQLPGFEYYDQFKYLAIVSDINDPDNEGFYKIQSLDVSALTGTIDGVFQTVHTGSQYAEWKLLGFMDDFVTEVRLVDEGEGSLNFKDEVSSFTSSQKLYGMESGATAYIISISDATLYLRNIKGRFINNESIKDDASGEATSDGKLSGVLNRDLINFLMSSRTVKPMGERIDLAYIDFLDQFIAATELDQWTDADSVTVPEPGGVAVIADAGYLMYQHNSNVWMDSIIRYKFLVDDSSTVPSLIFFYQNTTDYYAVTINYSTKLVSLLKYPGASVLDSKTLTYFKVGIQDMIRVEIEVVSGMSYIRVVINGNLELSASDSTYTDGGIKILSSGGITRLSLVEVCTLPINIDRIGPNP